MTNNEIDEINKAKEGKGTWLATPHDSYFDYPNISFVFDSNEDAEEFRW